MSKKTILVLYYTRGVYPLRDTIEKHLYSWKKYSKHRVIYINVLFGFPEELLSKITVDVVIFHTIFLGMRWSPDIFKHYTGICKYLKKPDCLKIAMPQDEFMQTDILNDFINDFGVTHILTCADEKDWPLIYEKIDRGKTFLKTVLTGYLDPETVKCIENMKAKTDRDIDIGYRAWKAEYWLGEQGMHKVRIAEEFEEISKEKGLKTDISMRNEDVLAGDDWFDFLLRCKATIGVEGGASVLDRYGIIKQEVDEYLEKHKDATFEETRRRCFPNEDNRLMLACISPRHLEACATETCQFLIEGTYNNILQPWQHYIPVKKDYSNVADVLNILRDEKRINKIVRTAYEDIVMTNKWTYEEFVREIEKDIIDAAITQDNPLSLYSFLVLYRLKLKDLLGWVFIRFEAWALYAKQGPNKFIMAFYRLILKFKRIG